MTNQQLPPSPLTDLMVGAVATFELFRAYVEAGFTEAQALHLVAQLMGAMRNQPGAEA